MTRMGFIAYETIGFSPLVLEGTQVEPQAQAPEHPMGIANPLDILNAINPSTLEIVQTVDALAALPDPVLKALLGLLDTGVLKKLGEWFATYTQVVNDVHHHRKDADLPLRLDTDFFRVMERTRYVGERIDEQDLEFASNLMTKAVKAANWKEAILVGVSLSRAGLV